MRRLRPLKEFLTLPHFGVFKIRNFEYFFAKINLAQIDLNQLEQKVDNLIHWFDF